MPPAESQSLFQHTRNFRFYPPPTALQKAEKGSIMEGPKGGAP